ncbi:hypothetical protein ABT090_25930 [Streptomyces asoensis]|uniref:hypothetical protein n=1 Tax=Streptomyces asoensis TaxID=249586 RepID=UPI00331A8D13
MTVVLGERWGGARVSSEIAALVLRAQYAAALDRSPHVRHDHLIAALGAAQEPAGWRTVLLAGGIPAERLSWSREAAARPFPVGGGPAEPPLPADDLREFLLELPGWARLTGDAHVTSVHLVAALAETTAEVSGSTPFHRLGLTADFVLSAAARHRSRGSGGDAAFMRGTDGRAGETGQEAFRLPPPPSTADLAVRTGKRGSPLLSRLMSAEGLREGADLGTPLALSRVRVLTASLVVEYALGAICFLAVGLRTVEYGWWWPILAYAPFSRSLRSSPLVVWLAARVLIAWLVPPFLVWLVLAWTALEAFGFRMLLLIRRVERADPALSRVSFTRDNRAMAIEALHDVFVGLAQRRGHTPRTGREESDVN